MKNKTALVTGASRGIGKAIALTLAKDGFDVIVNYKEKKDKALETAKEIEKLGKKAHIIQADVAKEEDVKRMFKEVDDFAGGLDVLVNNAAFDYAIMIEDFTIQQMREIVDVILIGRMITTKYFLPMLKKSKYPSIINIASRMGGPTTIPTIGAYGPAEAGIIKFTQCCALEFAPYKIRVNCVAPGLSDTDMTRGLFKDAEFWKAKAKSNPRGRVGQPQDHANMVAFLVSDKADYITGETILVTGGSNLN